MTAAVDWAALVGAGFVRAGAPADAVDGVVPAAVVRPGDVGEVRAIVRAAAAAGSAVVASGLGAHLEIGTAPRRLDVLLRLDRLGRIVDHQAADMTVAVEAGCPVAVLAETLGAAGQWLPLDPPRPEATTIGGLIAANLSGPLRASQGTVRDLLIGLRVVGADGALVSGGGRVVKNVAGYDLPKLHVGAFGSLGIVVEATFKVRPRPAVEGAVVIACRSAAQAGETALAVRDTVEPGWLVAAGARALADGPGDAAAVAAGFLGVAEEVADARRRVTETATRLGLRVVEVDDGAALRTRLGAFPAAPAVAILRCAVLPTAVGATMEQAEAAARVHGGTARCVAQAANGVVHVAVDGVTALAALLAALRARVAPGGGTVVVERAAPAAKRGLNVWGDVGPGLQLMRGVKAAYDPGGVLAPGRVAADVRIPAPRLPAAPRLVQPSPSGGSPPM